MKKIIYLLPFLLVLHACGMQPPSSREVTDRVNATLTDRAQDNPQVLVPQMTSIPALVQAQPTTMEQFAAPQITFTPVPVLVQPTAIQQFMTGEGNTLPLDVLRYGLYSSPDWGEFRLSDGVYYRTTATSQENPQSYVTRLMDPVLYGDINLDGSEDAVVFLNTQNGGTGHFVEMAAVLNLNGSSSNVSTLSLGDRVLVESGTIQNGWITLNLRVQGPNDPLCCPSQMVTWNFHLDHGQLVQISSWNTYHNPTYGYSLDHPDFYNIVTVSDEYVEIGDKITISVWNMDPTASYGDGPVVESTTDVQLSGYPAKLSTGYIGAVGGNIPHQFREVIVERNGFHFVVTLHAVGLHATEGDISQRVQLDPEDVSLFDRMVASMQIP